MSRVLFDRH